MHRRAENQDLNPAPLDTVVVGSRVLLFDELDSTNSRALQLATDGAVVIADRQTAGRGRHGRTWESPAGLGLWFSVLFTAPPDGLLFAGILAVRDALRRHCPNVNVKWPNDLLAGGKKICGMLLETRADLSALGIGINTHHTEQDFPDHLRHRATSLYLQNGASLPRSVILRDVLQALDRRYIELQSGLRDAIWQEWADACCMRGRHVTSGRLTGLVVALDSLGGLILETPDGRRRVAYGEAVEVGAA